MKQFIIRILFLLYAQAFFGQSLYAGFESFRLKDSARIYKPNTNTTDDLHFRPVDVDIWYPSTDIKGKPMVFEDLFQLFEQRAVNYQDNQDYTGITKELAQFYVAELGVGANGDELLKIQTESYLNLKPSQSKYPVIIYMAGFNGMGFENYKVLETLAQNGFVVVSIWSVGRYPGDMTNEMDDMLEQVYDAEFALNYLSKEKKFNVDLKNIGVLATSWGGISAAVLANRNENLKAMVSFDGTEIHYFGDTDMNVYSNGASADENDQFIQEIFDANLLNPESQNIKYLYFESGNKLDEFQPTKEYHYFKKLNTEKYYLRFTYSDHADFSCIPYILNSSENSVNTYKNIENSTLHFFNYSLKNLDSFVKNWPSITALDYTTDVTFDISEKPIKTEEIAGQIIDAKTKEPLSYVNIGILSQEIGTVSNREGNFLLEINNESVNDTVRISIIGYKPTELLVKNFTGEAKSFVIQLEEEISELNEVVITAKALKQKTLGNKTKSKFIGTGFGFDQLGAEMGIKINIRSDRTFVDAFNFNISHNSLSATSIFRLNFYDIVKGKPNENILSENILIPIESKQTGPITIDLKPYHIVLKEDVIVTLEWVDNTGGNKKGEAIFFPLGLLTNGTLYKQTSQAKFKDHSGLGVGFNIDVRY